ncbi:uncharacterized protein LOC120265968 [Dioscorea cayenensis subsp. rotundata]|uniref:Uncharacterized protein LOC120265968 n=1 Tax=Dioscorea cayennensis subsp. rotundata TaxID=55577 RepID=A0AB40BR97_DIOCR|nr:uncharacterized protein LOC120265968 [Dioscorea cayenensis subsp. rotundata]
MTLWFLLIKKHQKFHVLMKFLHYLMTGTKWTTINPKILDHLKNFVEDPHLLMRENSILIHNKYMIKLTMSLLCITVKDRVNSSACGGSSLLNHSAGTSEASFQDQPDFRLQNNMEQMDEIFLNSLLEDDLQNLGSPYEPLPMFPASAYRSMSFENFLTDVIVEPACLVKDCSFPESAIEIRDDGNKENSSSWSLIRDESKASEDSHAEPVMKSENDTITAVNEAQCLEETVLHKLEGVMTQLSEKTRICFRDALYRLAESSKKAEYRNRPPAAGEVNCDNSRNLKKGSESKTNAIDRTVANLLFTEPSMSPALSCEGPVYDNNDNTVVTGMQYSLDQSSGRPQATYYEDMDNEE